jgi:hypothetical protein
LGWLLRLIPINPSVTIVHGHDCRHDCPPQRNLPAKSAPDAIGRGLQGGFKVHHSSQHLYLLRIHNGQPDMGARSSCSPSCWAPDSPIWRTQIFHFDAKHSSDLPRRLWSGCVVRVRPVVQSPHPQQLRSINGFRAYVLGRRSSSQSNREPTIFDCTSHRSAGR